MDGMSFLSRIRQDSRYRRVPVIVCTVKELDPAEKLRINKQAQSRSSENEDMEKELKRMLRELLRHPHGKIHKIVAT